MDADGGRHNLSTQFCVSQSQALTQFKEARVQGVRHLHGMVTTPSDFQRLLTRPGPCHVTLVISDAHAGLQLNHDFAAVGAPVGAETCVFESARRGRART